MKPDIELHIEELVLHGFSNYNKYQIGQAVEREISRLLQEQGLPGTLSRHINFEHIDAGTFTLRPDSKAEIVGNNIANSVFKPLQNEKSGFLKNGK
jgi:hypothetical protein